MTPEDCLTPSQEATREARKALEAQARCSELSLDKLRQADLLDCALERVAELEAKGTVEEPKSEGRFPAKAYGGSS